MSLPPTSPSSSKVAHMLPTSSEKAKPESQEFKPNDTSYAHETTIESYNREPKMNAQRQETNATSFAPQPSGSVEDDKKDESKEDQAARVLQGAWGRRRNASARAGTADAQNRWHEMDVQVKAQVQRQAADEAKNDPANRWRRAGFIASRLQDADALRSDDPELVDDAAIKMTEKGKMQTKILETQHWLELIDGKHRYGSNLKFYFRRWVEADTEQNFFYWLDRGEGKDLDLEGCSRNQLNSERITYLSAEQRKNYLVKIDPKGLLRWVRNDVLVDTRADRWKDTEGGLGIVPIDGTEDREVEHRLRRKVSTLSGGPSPSSSSMSSLDETQDAQHYSGNPDQGKLKKAFVSRFTSNGITERLLKNTVKKNTWIYAADAKFNMFVGIKDTGTFQHSSLTGGGLITSAGLIKVKDGQIQSLSPLSGHYRTSIDHFKAFLEVLEERGADLHKVQRTKAEVALWGLSRWKMFKTAQATFVKEKKEGISDALHPGATSHVTADGSRVQDDAGKCLFEAKKEKILREKEAKGQSRSEANGENESESSQDEEDSSWLPDSWRIDVLKGRKRKVRAQSETSPTNDILEAAHDSAQVDDPPSDGRKTLKTEEDKASQGKDVNQLSDGGAEALGTTKTGTDVENPRGGDLGITTSL